MWKHLGGISLELPDDLPDRLGEYLRRSGEPRSLVAIAGVSRPELGRGSLHEIRILAAAEEEEEWRDPDLQRQVLDAQDALDRLRASIGEPPPSKLLATLRDRAQRGEPPGAVQRRDYGVDLAIVDENGAPPRE